MSIVLFILEVLFGLILMGLILAQKSKADALSGLVHGSKNESFFLKNKKNTREGKLEKFTWVFLALFMVNTILINVLL